jgi:hypothetical protein
MKTVVAVLATAAVISGSGWASSRYAEKQTLEARVVRLEGQMRERRAEVKESRRRERILFGSVTDALVHSGQATILAGQLQAELECVEQLPLVDLGGLGIRVAHPEDIVDWRMAVIDNKCRGWLMAR